MKKFDKVNLSEAEIQAIEAIISDFEDEDRFVRERQIRTWKKQEFYWSGFQNIWWDAVAHDWRIYGYPGDSTGDDSGQSEYYDKNINVYRAYQETIIAALSASIPGMKCIPDDADNDNDVQTAKGGNKILQLVYRHNDAPLLWIRALWIYCMQGMIAAYNYSDEDDSYGSVDVPKEEDSEIEVNQQVCSNCGEVLSSEEVQQSEQIKSVESDEYDPGDDDVELGNLIADDKLVCPKCLVDADPELKRDKVVVTRITGITRQPKARQCIEVNGGLYVKVPNWARTQKECPYLSYCFETHYSNIYEKYPELYDELNESNTTLNSPDGNQLYERWGRLSTQYRGEYPLNTPTERHWWLRPAAFNTLNDDKLRKRLKKKFPVGCYAILVNDHFVKACNESLDDHWTLTFNPMANSVHYDPLGTLATSIQEITSTLVSLTLQSIEHGVPITFADPTVLNFTQFGNTEVAPGDVYPAKPKSGKSLSDGFFTTQTTTLSQEVGPFGQRVNEMGQFVTGATPQVWGGSSNASSRTASQYAMQRNQALQRLQTPWKMLSFWWKNVSAKIVPAYIKDMLEDERLVQEQGKDNFVNILIRRAELDGKIGSVELEASEGMPQTQDQIRDTVMNLLQTGQPEILAALGQPENLPIIASIFGMTGFVVPGEDDREKQYEEIAQLLQGQPIPGPNGSEMPSVMPELDVDDHKVEAEITRDWLVSEKGRQAKVDNPTGYKNILLHLQAHIQMMQQLMNPGGQSQPNQPQSNQNGQPSPADALNPPHIPPGGQTQTQPPQSRPKLRPIKGGVQ